MDGHWTYTKLACEQELLWALARFMSISSDFLLVSFDFTVVDISVCSFYPSSSSPSICLLHCFHHRSLDSLWFVMVSLWLVAVCCGN